MNKDQFEKFTKWQDETFPSSTALSKALHLEQEVGELIEAIKSGDNEVRKEIADCVLLTLGAAAKLGMSYEDIVNCIDEKMNINIQRTWGKPDKNGVVKHID